MSEITEVFRRYQSDGCPYCGGGEGDVYLAEKYWEIVEREIRALIKQRPRVDMEFIDKWQWLIEKLYHTKLYAVTLISMLKEAGIEVTYCDLKEANSSLPNWNIKSGGNRSLFRFTAWIKTLVETP